MNKTERKHIAVVGKKCLWYIEQELSKLRADMPKCPEPCPRDGLNAVAADLKELQELIRQVEEE